MPSAVSQMFEHALDVVKGWPGALEALDKAAKLADDLLTGLTAVPAGRVAHLNAIGEFELGGSGTQMPIFLWQGKGDPDVYNDGVSPATDVAHWVSISPTGVMSGVVATGGFEIQTTEFDGEQVYAPNDLLTASNVGVLTNVDAVQYVDWICGVCSSHVNADNQSVGLGLVADPCGGPVGHNAHMVQTITFWSYFLPESVR